MGLLEKVSFAFHAGLSQFFIFTGTAEKPEEKFNVTPSVHEGIIATYLTKPGILKAPDGSEFLLELTLLPASREAKQRLLDEAQAKVNAANSLVTPEPPKGSKAWLDAQWALTLIGADKGLFERIGKARASGNIVKFRFLPFELRVLLTPGPKRKKNAAAVPVAPAEAYDAAPTPPSFTDELPQQQVERIAVVVVKFTDGRHDDVIPRKVWDTYGQDHSGDWLEACKQNYCYLNDINYESIIAVDFSQMRDATDFPSNR